MKILIIVEGGIVQDVYSDVQGLDVRLIDMDILEGCTEEEELEFLEDNQDILTDGEEDYGKIKKEYPHNVY